MRKLDRLKIKKRILQILKNTHSGHAASCLSCVDLICKLYEQIKSKKKIIILSKGHAVLTQYVILNELGIFPQELLDTYCSNGGLGEHSTLDIKHGIYASTGSLGHGLAIGIGYALADKLRPVAVVIGDGELDEGSTLEALRIIKKLQIRNIMVICDVNGWQGFSQFCGDIPEGVKPYYGTKGEGMGLVEDTVDSHYQYVDEIKLKEWSDNLDKLEESRNL